MHLSRAELQRVTRRFTMEIINVIGPDTDIPAPDMGTNEQVMAWLMDTYSQHVGHAVPAIVTGKPPALGGSVARREATGSGLMFLLPQAARHVGIWTPMAPGWRSRVRQRWPLRGGGRLRKMGCRVVAVSDISGTSTPRMASTWPQPGEVGRREPGPGGISRRRPPRGTGCSLPLRRVGPGRLQGVITRRTPTNPGPDHHRGGQQPHQPRCRRPAAGAGRAHRPDILANAGGVTVSYFEWVQDVQKYFWSENEIVGGCGRS
jgi:glutamate dehydrogenase (NAD(P)+)